MTKYQPHMPKRNHSHGFTLVELMVTIAVMGIIASMAAPSMSRAMANQRVKSTATTIENALTQARVESAIRKKNVTVSLSGTVADNVLIDNTLIVKAGTEELSKYKLNKRSSVEPPTMPSASDPKVTITFLPSSKVNSTTSITYTVCDSSSIDETPLQIVASPVGKITIKQAGTCS